jgi:hypothetical protein
MVQSMIVGLLVIGLGLVKGSTKKRYGGGWKALWSDDDLVYD